MKKLKTKKIVRKPIQSAHAENYKKYISDMGIGFRVVNMNADQSLNN